MKKIAMKTIAYLLLLLSSMALAAPVSNIHTVAQCTQQLDDFAMLINYTELCNPAFSVVKATFAETTQHIADDFKQAKCSKRTVGDDLVARIEKYAVDEHGNQAEVKAFCVQQRERAFGLLSTYHSDYSERKQQ